MKAPHLPVPLSALIELETALVVDFQPRILLVLAQDAIAGDEKLDFRTHEAAKRVLGRTHDRLAANVETGVHQHRAAGASVESREEIVEPRVSLAMYRLHACGIVDVGHGRNVRTRHVEFIDSE